MGWFSTVLKVVHTTSGLLLKTVGAEYNQDATGNVTTTIGALTFTFISDAESKKTTVQNSDNVEYYIYFSRVEDNGFLSCAQKLIQPNEIIDVTNLMAKYRDGHITYVPFSTGSKGRVISFTAEYILHDETIFSTDDDSQQQYVLTRNNEGDMFIFSATQEFDSFEISFTDKNNINFNLRDVKIDTVGAKPHVLYEARVNLPPGCSNNYPFKDVRINMSITAGHAEYLRGKLLADKR